MLIPHSPSDIFCPLKQLFFSGGVQKFVRQQEKWCCYFPSLNANANIKNFRHLLLDVRGLGWLLAGSGSGDRGGEAGAGVSPR